VAQPQFFQDAWAFHEQRIFRILFPTAVAIYATAQVELGIIIEQT
jgi:hypothetical protein